jgi:hypothetical protein
MSTEAPVETPKLSAGERFAAKLAAEPITPVAPATPPPAETVAPVETAEPVVETPAETTVVAETPTFIEQAKALGFEDLSEEDAHQRVLTYVAQMREENARLEAERQQLLALRQPIAPVAATQTNEAPKPWVPPSIDRNLVAEYREAKLDPTSGKQIAAWKEGTPAEVRQSVERFEQWQKQWAEALTTRPHEVLTDMVRQIAADVASQQYTQAAQTREVESFKSQVLKDNPWLYEQDPLTKRPTQNLSAEGQRMYAYCEEAVSLGIHQPQAQWKYAEQQRELATLRAKTNAATTAQTAAQINAQKKQATVDASLAAKGLAAPANNIPSPRSQTRPLTAGQRFAQKMAAEGVPT